MSFVQGLQCKNCGRKYPVSPTHICEFCFGGLEVMYDYAEIKKVFDMSTLRSRPNNIWRYRELLPIDKDPVCGLNVGFTPLIRANRLEKTLGIKEVYIKNDAVNHPTLSFKDRVVAVAISKAVEFSYDTVACASTGNLANSVAALASSCGLKSYVFIPWDLEVGKVLGTLIYGAHLIGVKGTYDDVNRLCSEIAENFDWAFVNINIRPFYSEGSKTFGFEIAEQLNFKLPDHIVVPMGGGSLITKIWKAFKELETLGFIDKVKTKVHGAQAEGANPIVSAYKQGRKTIKPVKPNTIAKSLAIGNPADGVYALQTIKESGGSAEDVTDDEIVEGIKMLAREEGIFTETAGGVTVAVTKKLKEKGIIGAEDSVVIAITGNGLKTQEAIKNSMREPTIIEPNLKDFERIYSIVF
ncbi:MAG: threonine synthase [Deltaproteobacteria bacterium]|nr:threonine synthase [Candidatus Caldarchaeum sp.]MDW8002750.1 threonine synthase [Deltaproteobacteria bacterium]